MQNAETFQSRLFTKAVERFPQGRPPSAEEVAGETVSVNGGLSFGGW